MKKMALWGIAFVALAGWAVAQAPAPGTGRAGAGGPGGDPEARLQARLGLNDEQMEQLHKLKLDRQKAEVQRKAALQVARLEMNELFRAASVDEKAVAAKLKVVSDLEVAGLKARVDERLALRKIVTAEQAEQIEKMVMGRHRARAAGARGRQGRPGQPGQRRGPGPQPGWDPQPGAER